MSGLLYSNYARTIRQAEAAHRREQTNNDSVTRSTEGFYRTQSYRKAANASTNRSVQGVPVAQPESILALPPLSASSSSQDNASQQQQVYAPDDRCCSVCATGRFLPTCSTITATASTSISRQGSTSSHHSSGKRRKKHSSNTNASATVAKPLSLNHSNKFLLRADSKARKKVERFERERQWWAQNIANAKTYSVDDSTEEKKEEDNANANKQSVDDSTEEKKQEEDNANANNHPVDDSTKKREEEDYANANNHPVGDSSTEEKKEDVGAVALLHPEELTLGKPLGEGGSCIVHEVTDLHLLLEDDIVKTKQQTSLRNNLLGSFSSDTKHPEGRYVVKQLSPKFELGNGIIQVDPLYIEAVAADLILEVRILQALGNRHPNIISLHGASVAEEEMPFLLLSKCTESLQQRIMKWRTAVQKCKDQLESPSLWSLLGVNTSAGGPPPRPAVKLRKLLWERLWVVRDVGLAVEHLHSNGIVYRDLKVSNIGFDAAGIVKIFDFGLARFLPRAEAKEKRRKQGEEEEKQTARDLDAKSVRRKDSPSTEAATAVSEGQDSRPSRTHWHEQQRADSGPIADRQKNLEFDGSGSAVAAEDGEVFAMSCVGTEFTMAPEVMKGHSYNLKADVYSYGVLMWQLLAPLTPHSRPGARDANGEAILFPLFEFVMCPCWPKKTQQVLTSLLAQDPVARPSMKQSIQQLSLQLEILERAFAPQEKEHAVAQRHQQRQQDSSSLLRSLFHQRQLPQQKGQDSSG